MIDAIENNTKVLTPDKHEGRVRVTRRERELIEAGKQSEVNVLGSDGLTRHFDLEDLIIIPPRLVEEEAAMSNEREPINITINVSDTVPLTLFQNLECHLHTVQKLGREMEQTAAELRIEVAALTVSLDTHKSRIKGLHEKVRELEAYNKELRVNLLKEKEINQHA